MSKYTFPAVLKWAEEDQSYEVYFPDVNGCATAGADLTETLENAKDALNLMLWGMEHDGEVIFPPLLLPMCLSLSMGNSAALLLLIPWPIRRPLTRKTTRLSMHTKRQG